MADYGRTAAAPAAAERPEPAQSHSGTSTSAEPRKEDEYAPGSEQEKPGQVGAKGRALLAKLGLDVPTIRLMLKGAVAPTVAIAMYQATPIARLYGNQGYLVGIFSVLAMPILPRGKFIQTIVLNILFACAAAATACLVMWTALQARIHTTDPADPAAAAAGSYNSSQAAVAAVWLFALVWIVNTFRAKNPALNVPAIVYTIISNISCTFAPFIRTTAAMEAFVRQLLFAVLTAFAISAATCLFVLPVTSRTVTGGQARAWLNMTRQIVGLEKAYLQSLEREDMFAAPADVDAETGIEGGRIKKEKNGAKNKKKNKQNGGKEKSTPDNETEAEVLKQSIFRLRELVGRIQADLPFARREIAWGKLTGADLKTVMGSIRAITVPVIGISTTIDVFQRLAERRGWTGADDMAPETAAASATDRDEERRLWNEVMRQLHEPFGRLTEAIDDGLQHVGTLLGILPTPPTKKNESKGGDKNGDAEARAGCDQTPQPGDDQFGEHLGASVRCFRGVRSQILAAWARSRGLVKNVKADDEGADMIGATESTWAEIEERRRRDQAQLFILLYIDTLMQCAGDAVLRFVAFADEKKRSGALDKNRLILPSSGTIKRWARALVIVRSEDGGSRENEGNLLEPAGGGPPVYHLGDGFDARRDPEHLQPVTAWERIGDRVRAVSRFVASEESMFGFRVASATMTIGIVAFLEPSWQFFQEQRLVWAMFMVAIGMTRTSGQSLFGFACRIFGTFVGMCVALLNWWVVDQRTIGILVLFYFLLAIEFGVLVKFPRFIPAALVCIITHVMIIGYELEAVKVGIATLEATRQRYYPIYTLAPYRLAIVAAGCLIGFIWTIFPAPVTERTWLRRDIAAVMGLLASYSTAINGALRCRLLPAICGGDPAVKGTPANRLVRHRQHLLGRLLLLLPSLREHADFQRWEPTVGGRFPRALYEDMIRRATRLNSYLTLISHTVGPSPSDPPSRSRQPGPATINSEWAGALAAVLPHVSPLQRSYAHNLTLLSYAVSTGHALPPHMTCPRPHREMMSRLEAATTTDTTHSILDASHLEDEGYAELAVLQVCSALICDDIEGLIGTVSELVGVVDFSFTVERGLEDRNEGAGGEWSSDGGWREVDRRRKGDGPDDQGGKGKVE